MPPVWNPCGFIDLHGISTFPLGRCCENLFGSGALLGEAVPVLKHLYGSGAFIGRHALWMVLPWRLEVYLLRCGFGLDLYGSGVLIVEVSLVGL